jgi:D-threonate/D-erythronate kinase
MNPLRLVADDLTGALDAAAPFASPGRPVPVFAGDRLPAVMPASYAVDLGTRDLERASAAALAARHAGLLRPGRTRTAFRKLDSLLRGHGGSELAATLAVLGGVPCLIAPAFPDHRRVTRGGRQGILDGGRWVPCGEDLRATLEAQGVRVHLARPGEPAGEGASLWDAESDDDLRRIVEAGRRLPGPVLWCGSGGLAAALAGSPPPAWTEIGRPVLGLFGSDDPASLAQVAACGEHVLRLASAGAREAGLAADRLDRTGLCLVAFEVPPGRSRAEASAHIAREIRILTAALPAPRSLIAAGGETLRSALQAVNADWLDASGQMMPGVPVSIVRGGRWAGTVVVSKSGAFGEPLLLRRLLRLPSSRPP